MSSWDVGSPPLLLAGCEQQARTCASVWACHLCAGVCVLPPDRVPKGRRELEDGCVFSFEKSCQIL